MSMNKADCLEYCISEIIDNHIDSEHPDWKKVSDMVWELHQLATPEADRIRRLERETCKHLN